MQLTRPEHGEDHAPAEVCTAQLDVEAFSDDGASAIATDEVITFEDLTTVAVGLGDGQAHAVVVLLERIGRPAEESGCGGDLGEALSQDLFGEVLGQALVGGVVEAAHLLSPGRREPVLAHQRAVHGDATDGIAGRQDARSPQLLLDAPEMEVLQGARGQVLALRDVLQPGVTLDNGAGDAALAELDREGDAHGPAADDDNLIALRVSHMSLEP